MIPGKGRKFRPGEMNSLVEYLTSHCPPSDGGFEEVSQSDEDTRLSKVLNKQMEYQKQLKSQRNSLDLSSDVSFSERAAAPPRRGSGRLSVGDSVNDSFNQANNGMPFARVSVRNDESLTRNDVIRRKYSILDL